MKFLAKAGCNVGNNVHGLAEIMKCWLFRTKQV